MNVEMLVTSLLFIALMSAFNRRENKFFGLYHTTRWGISFVLLALTSVAYAHFLNSGFNAAWLIAGLLLLTASSMMRTSAITKVKAARAQVSDDQH